MMTTEQLMGALLEYAMQGKLVPQKVEEGSSKELLQIIQTNKIDLIRKGELRSNKKESFIYSEEGHYYDQIGKKVTCIDDEIPFEIPMTWCWKRLENVAYMSDGVHFAPKYIENGIPCFSAKDIYGDEIHKEKCNYITRTDYEEMREKINVKKDSILVTKSGTIGRTAVVHDYFEFGLVESIGVINSLGVDADYIKLLLDYGFWYTGKYYSQYTNGIAVKHLTLSLLGKVLIPIPPLAEQKRIVAKVDELMPFVEQYAAANTKLNTLNASFPEMMRKSILQEAVQGKLVPQNPNDEPASLLLKKIAEEKKRLIKEGKIKKQKPLPEITEDEIPFDIPESWEWIRLSDISKQITDGEHSTPKRVSDFCGFYLLSARNVRDGEIKLDDVDYVDNSEFERISSRCNPVKGDILISCSGSVGRCAVVNDDNKYVMVRSAAMASPIMCDSNYLMYAIQSDCVQRQINALKKQTAQANLFLGAISVLKLPLPPYNEQKRIVSKLNQVLSHTEKAFNTLSFE